MLTSSFRQSDHQLAKWYPLFAQYGTRIVTVASVFLDLLFGL